MHVSTKLNDFRRIIIIDELFDTNCKIPRKRCDNYLLLKLPYHLNEFLAVKHNEINFIELFCMEYQKHAAKVPIMRFLESILPGEYEAHWTSLKPVVSSTMRKHLLIQDVFDEPGNLYIIDKINQIMKAFLLCVIKLTERISKRY